MNNRKLMILIALGLFGINPVAGWGVGQDSLSELIQNCCSGDGKCNQSDRSKLLNEIAQLQEAEGEEKSKRKSETGK